MQVTDSAVFDLDDTLLDSDSTTVWIKNRVSRSWWRYLLAIAAFPVAMPLIAVPRLRRLGTTIFLWIASVGLSEQSLKDSFDAFAECVYAGDEPELRWYKKGLNEIKQYLDRGSQVAVVTAAAAWIAVPLVARIDARIEISGSGLRRFMGGWILSDHCRHVHKCEALRAMGFGESWTAAYSDSFDDLPMLSRARFAYGINVSEKSRRKFEQRRVNIHCLNWLNRPGFAGDPNS